MDEDEEDAFELLLQEIKENLIKHTDIPNENISIEIENQENPILMSGRDLIIRNIGSEHWNQCEVERVRYECRQRMEWVESFRNQQLRSRQLFQSKLEAKMKIFEERIYLLMQTKNLQKRAFERQSEKSYQSVTRRLQDLVCESIGEAQKTVKRAEMFAQQKNSNNIETLDHERDNHLWNLFLLRLEEDSLGAITTEDIKLSSSKFSAVEALHRDEGSLLGHVSNAALVSYNQPIHSQTESVNSSTVSKLSRTASKGVSKSVSRRPAVCGSSRDALSSIYNDAGLQGYQESNLFHDNEAIFHRRISSKSVRLPKYPVDMLLEASTVAWCMWPSFGQILLDSRVYYSVDERFQLTRGTEASGETIDSVLGETYATATFGQVSPIQCLEHVHAQCTSDNKWPNGFLVSHRDGRHRKQVLRDGGIIKYPDVIVAQSPSIPGLQIRDGQAQLHFAPATIKQLLETKRFLEFSTKTIPSVDRTTLRNEYPGVRHNTFQNLYVVIPLEHPHLDRLGKVLDPSHITHTQLVPLPANALDELFGCYILRQFQDHNSCELLLGKETRLGAFFPADPIGTSYNRKKTPSEGDRAVVARTGSSRRQLRPESTNTSKLGKRNAQAVLLRKSSQDESHNGGTKGTVWTSLCTWRSCNVGTNLDTEGLCRYHHQCAEAINPSGTKAKAKRPLPTMSKEELVQNVTSDAILQASSLSSELMSGVLATTIDNFCSTTAQSSAPTDPVNEESLEALTISGDELERELVLTDIVREVENEVCETLSVLLQFGYFPADELARIRQEYSGVERKRQKILDNTIRTPERLEMYREWLAKTQSECARLLDPSAPSSSSDSNWRMLCEANEVTTSQIETELELEFSLKKLHVFRIAKDSINNLDFDDE